MSNRNNNYESNKRKRRGKSVLRTLGIILASALMSCAFMAFSNFAKENIFDKERDPDNLLTVEVYSDAAQDDDKTFESDKGLKVNWKKDGSFTLYGKHSDSKLTDEDIYTYAFASITLPAGQYTIDSGNDDADEDTFGLMIQYGTQTEYVCDKDKTITLDGETLVTVSLFVKNNYRVWFETLYPTIASGDKAIDFYD